MFKKHKLYYSDSSSWKSVAMKISKYLLSQRKQLNQVIFVCIFDKYCMYRQVTSYIFSMLFILLFRITFFLEKQVAICTTTAQYLFKV